MSKKTKKPSSKRKAKKLSRKLSWLLLVLILIWTAIGEWFVHHSRHWIKRQQDAWPVCITESLLAFGGYAADITDGLGLTGHDAVYEYDTEAPSGQIAFAGLPIRKADPAPNDIQIIRRNNFIIGWSPSLHHPVWCAYHVISQARFEDGTRPSFLIDKETPGAPRPDAYTNSGYDRGHMVPNHAIISRYGKADQRQTFLMSNIAPQRPALNRDVWRDLEHRIADLWTQRYGEIWVVVGAIPSTCAMKIGPGIDVPSAFYQVVIAQEKMDVRAFATIFPDNSPWNAWAARGLISIDELEELTGLDFNPDLPSFIQDPLEAELPSRLWPVKPLDIFKQLALRFAH